MTRKLGFYGAKLNAEYEFPNGLQLRPELDPLEIPTINGITTNLDGSPIRMDQRFSEAEALALVAATHQDFVDFVDEQVTVEVNQNQFDALVLLCLNAGQSAFAKSTVLRLTNERQFQNAAAAFGMWIYGTDTLDGKRWMRALRGLYRRQLATGLLFLSLAWADATDNERVELRASPVDEGHRYKDKVEFKTPWMEVLERARTQILPPPPVVEEKTENDVTRDLNEAESERLKREPVTLGKMPPSLPPSPTGYGKIDPTAPPKEWWQSRREWGRIIQLMTLSVGAERVTNTQAIAAAEIGGLAIIVVIGFVLTKWGERKATRYTK